MALVKKALLVLLVGFLLFYLIAQPESAAGAVRTVLDGLGTAFGSIVTFFQSLAG